MVLGVRKRFWMLFGLALAMAAGVIFAQVSPFFAVKRAIYSGPLAEKARQVSEKCINASANIFALDLDEMLNQTLTWDEIGQISVKRQLPDAIRAEVNHFEPVALAMASLLYGVDQHCRLIPYDTAWQNVNLPVLTNFGSGRLFRCPDDFRISGVVTGLVYARDHLPGVYQRLAEIDFSDSILIAIYLTSGREKYYAAGHDFAGQLGKLQSVHRLIEGPDGGCYHLQYDGLVVRKECEGRNVADSADSRT